MFKLKKNTISKGIIYMIICTLLTASGQILFKLASNNIQLNVYSIITNIPFIIGITLYGLASIFMILAFRKEKLSKIFPLTSLSFIWVFLIAVLIFKENISINTIIANIIIIMGIILIGVNK